MVIEVCECIEGRLEGEGKKARIVFGHDCDTVRAVNRMIPMAEVFADNEADMDLGVAGRGTTKYKSAWDRAFHERMDYLCIRAGLRVPFRELAVKRIVAHTSAPTTMAATA